MSSGGGGQEVVQTGPSIQAASSAAQAQVTAAQMAAQAATQNTQSALQALMGEYTTGLGLTQPIRAEGNQAAAQLNYMLGLPAAPLGVAPTAPTQPTLQSEEANITPAQIQQYIEQNTSLTGLPSGGGQGYGNWEGLQYNGVGQGPQGANINNDRVYINGNTPNGELSTIVGNLTNNPVANQAITANLAQQQLQTDLANYNNVQEPLYQQQESAYNQAKDIYNQYSAMGTATPANITDVVQNLPGYQFQQNQGINSIQNAASASGMLNSGALLQQLNQFGQGLASSYYQNYLNNLQGLAGLGTGATQQAVSAGNQTGAQAANQYSNLGTDIGNSYLAAGQAMASSYLSPLASQQIQTTNVGGGSGGGMSGIGGILSGIGSLAGAFGGL